MAFCSNCGQSVDDTGNYCPHCGYNLKPSPPNQTLEVSQQGEAILEEEYIAFIGPEAPKYINKFKSFNISGVEEFKLTWHWPAFFVGFWWFLYRKLYLAAIITLVLCFIPYLNIISPIALGVLGNYIYFKHATGKIKEVKSYYKSESITDILSKMGGINSWVTPVAIIVAIVSFITLVIIFAIAALDYYW